MCWNICWERAPMIFWMHSIILFIAHTWMIKIINFVKQTKQQLLITAHVASGQKFKISSQTLRYFHRNCYCVSWKSYVQSPHKFTHSIIAYTRNSWKKYPNQNTEISYRVSVNSWLLFPYHVFWLYVCFCAALNLFWMFWLNEVHIIMCDPQRKSNVL